MKKTFIIIPVFILFVLGAGAYLQHRKNTIPTPAPSAAEREDNARELTNENQTIEPTANTGSYVDYREGIIAETKGDKVLFFYAPWSSQCHSIESDIKEQGVPKGLTIIKIDYDSAQELRQKYEVNLQTTFVKVDDSGNKTAAYDANNEPTFEAVKRNFL